MKSLVFFNNKGGVGKTTLTCNVVSYLTTHTLCPPPPRETGWRRCSPCSSWIAPASAC